MSGGIGPAGPAPFRLDPEAAYEALAADARFAPVVRAWGPPDLPDVPADPFAYLVRAITHQQLATAAARTIHARLVEALGGDVGPGPVLGVPEEVLRRAGLSAAKTRSVTDLAERVAGGSLRLDGWADLADDEVTERLVQVRGIGPWTADMFLIFFLRRPDVWPVGDLGVRSGWARIHGLEEPPTARELAPLGERLRPWRSAAAWYCWRALDEPPGATDQPSAASGR